MPIREIISPFHDNYFQYGYTGKKYYYNVHSNASRQNAYNRALRQAKAIHSNK
jgi:hypothetical protein